MKAVELRQRSESELRQTLKELKEKMFNFKFQQILGQIENTSQIRLTKRDIARIETVVRQKAREKEKQAP